MKIEPVWLPHYVWEDVDMYHSPSKKEKEEKEIRLDKAIQLLTNQTQFYEIASKMVKAFPNACIHNLTKANMNRIAYIGQASCFFKDGIKEEETREAWSYLTEQQRTEANETARRVLNEWEIEYIKNHA